mmetsp:Transcript_4523/g.11371  ORF Transcript_4523/g.11371 Transcript_4523/m.11371 type:complete len:234 (-) Transcript_4523:301-1002(-)
MLLLFFFFLRLAFSKRQGSGRTWTLGLAALIIVLDKEQEIRPGRLADRYRRRRGRQGTFAADCRALSSRRRRRQGRFVRFFLMSKRSRTSRGRRGILVGLSWARHFQDSSDIRLSLVHDRGSFPVKANFIQAIDPVLRKSGAKATGFSSLGGRSLGVFLILVRLSLVGSDFQDSSGIELLLLHNPTSNLLASKLLIGGRIHMVLFLLIIQQELEPSIPGGTMHIPAKLHPILI